MKNILFLLTLLLISNIVNAQSDTTMAKPIKGMSELSLKALGIEFPPPLRDKLHGVEVEFIFDIDEFGVGSLAEVNGVRDAAIIDSFHRVYKPFILFYPLMIDSIPHQSFFFFKVNFPRYNQLTEEPVLFTKGFSYQKVTMADFENIEFSKNREEVSFGGFLNIPMGGQRQNYLDMGGGMDLDLVYMLPKILLGMNVNIAGIKRRQNWPELNTTREHAKYPSSLHFNLYGGYFKDNWSLQLEGGASSMNLLFRLDEQTNDGIQTKGSNIALTYKYKKRLSKDKPVYVYGTPYVIRYDLQLLLRSRYSNYDYKYANGISLELGCALATHYKRIKSFKMKKQFN